MSKSNGKIWPYAISASIILVFIAAIATVVISVQLPVEKSDTYMMYYQEADANANELIQAKIDFDKKYKIEYITDGLSQEETTFKYKVSDLENNPVNNAKVLLVVTRPNNHKSDKTLKEFSVENGVYTFSSTTLPKPGRWDIMAKVNVGEFQRFYNVKADTRAKEAFEY